MSEKIRLSLAILASSAAGAALWWTLQKPQVVLAGPPRKFHIQTRVVTPVPEPPAEELTPQPTLIEVDTATINKRIDALARELSTMWTRNPEELVTVIDDASRNDPASPSVTLLLAIAHAETNGKILDVSEAGAVGLAQATPVACRQEKFDGPMFVTADYLIGSRAYIMKKPLGDADTIASLVVAKDDAKTRSRAKRLLESAKTLRSEGIDELQLLAPYASKRYFANIKAADEHNAATLKHLGHLLDKGSRAELRTFRDETRKEYRSMKQTQLAAWKRYQKDLAAERDRRIEKHFNMHATYVKKNMAYAAGEYLGETFDERFSAKQMASFLVRHLERKAKEARKLARSESKVEEMTAALYNGGSHNVKRMLAGLIGSLPETERYMKKVPATKRRLDLVIEPVVKEARVTR
ncbi:MAG: hypothetical protein JOZ54_20030 [Acidobacteria bacterium]|nr:hypothetical protein [Acidobacteriota bacterium]